MPMLGIFQPNYISGIGMRTLTCTSEVYNAARKVCRRTIGVRVVGGGRGLSQNERSFKECTCQRYEA